MLDLHLIRSEPERLRNALLKRMDTVDFTSVLALDDRRRALISTLDPKRAMRKEVAKQIGLGRKANQNTSELEGQADALKREIAEQEAELATTEAALRDALAEFPNYPDERVPAGGKEGNRVVRTWGDPPTLPQNAADHVRLSQDLGLVDYERGTKLGGTGFWLYTGLGAALEWALLDFFNRTHFASGYRFVLPPHLLVDTCGFTAGQFPKFRDDVFHLATSPGERARFLLPTAETAILNVYRDEILNDRDLPLRLFAYSPCYRREGGSYRTEERGTIRGHQFNKVEMFQFVAPEDAESALNELVRKAEELVEALGLHYRTSLLAAKDASAAMALTYDIEVWVPSISQYKEVSSVSWARDYQSRRADIRFRRSGQKKTEFIHTLNGSGLATSRLLPALVEQLQQPDGSVTVPEVLRDWLKTDRLCP